ncbi:sugar 3,4-ketoisomerase [Agathobaculum desmolans]|uniref:sugar 3,4-ketoisomerase n=1 Tax=Agathobaculum desmolans TaxID=39484 RepID=UPI0038B34874
MKNNRMLPNTRMIQFRDIGDSKLGHLTPLEAEGDIPFPIRRVYYITRVPRDMTRGFHSHRQLEQVLICLHGSVKIRVKTPFEEQVVELSNPAEGLFIGHMVWREMFDFSDGAVLMVLASEHYSELDYIRCYDDYEVEAISYFQSKIEMRE